MNPEITKMVAEASAAKPTDAQVTQASEASEGVEQDHESVQPEEQKGGDTKQVKDPWPRSAVNAISRREKKLAKRDAELADYRKQLAERDAELAKYKKPVAASDPSDPEPVMANYTDWNQYQRDAIQWNIREAKRQESAAQQSAKPQQEASPQFTPQQMAYVHDRIQTAAKRETEIIKAHPEFEQVFTQSQDALADLPTQTQIMLLQCEDPALAVLGLAHDGILDDLGEMGQGLAQRTIKAAVAKGKELAGTQAAQTKAPAPMTRPKTPSRSQRDPSQLNDDEFRAKYLNRR